MILKVSLSDILTKEDCDFLKEYSDIDPYNTEIDENTDVIKLMKEVFDHQNGLIDHSVNIIVKIKTRIKKLKKIQTKIFNFINEEEE